MAKGPRELLEPLASDALSSLQGTGLKASLKPCRSGATGTRPFGVLGPPVDPTNYEAQLAEKVASVKRSLDLLPAAVLDSAAVFPSPPVAHRHRATFQVCHGTSSRLELTHWDPVARQHSTVRVSDVPIYSEPINAIMEVLRVLPIALDAECPKAVVGAGRVPESLRPLVDEAVSSKLVNESPWGSTIGRGLRSVQMHSTLSGDVLLCFVYNDPSLRDVKRGMASDSGDNTWKDAARALRTLLSHVVSSTQSRSGRVDVIGRWKRKRLCVDRDYVIEEFSVKDGRTLIYKQPEGQFSNPNAACEMHCFDWLCREAGAMRQECPAGAAKILELHCGGGNNTVALAPYFDEIVAIEINRILADTAEENLRTNCIENVRLLRAASASASDLLRATGVSADSLQGVLVDPPRSGLDVSTREAISGFEHILYISCNPDALAGDIACLAVTHEVLKLAIFDMFPYTSHAECAVRLRRRRASLATRFACFDVLKRFATRKSDTTLLFGFAFAVALMAMTWRLRR
eukprot:TRINITY_DN20155_c0_g3_i1.p1 TRINITY_DN20155_c0_g3~~TRINITY_DN20155_c0_g3_i1.p1  ORF type:complete len:534 (-),score=47.74 TRINITY_DN20155_c0_g3_i1:83-1633(-)